MTQTTQGRGHGLRTNTFYTFIPHLLDEEN